MFAAGKAAGGGDPGTVAVVGAVTGVCALLWNVWRSVREGPRLHPRFYIVGEYVGTPDDHDNAVLTGARAELTISNFGTIPAYVDYLALAKTLPWHYRVPLIRALPYRVRHRWPMRHLFKHPSIQKRVAFTELPLPHIVSPGEVIRGQLDIASECIDEVAGEWVWAIVETGLRRYHAKVVDNRDVA